MAELYRTLDHVLASGVILPAVNVPGRYQPPFNINQWNYVESAFNIAARVNFLLVTPQTLDGSHRSKPEANIFSISERESIIRQVLLGKGIMHNRCTLSLFDFTQEYLEKLDPDVPTFINTYSEWSWKKEEMLRKAGLPIIHAEIPKERQISGADIRAVLSKGFYKGIESDLMKNGLIPEAVQPVLKANLGYMMSMFF